MHRSPARLYQDRCSQFSVNVDYTGTSINEIREVQGTWLANCKLDDGSTLVGDITFNDCH
jgi:hypothetical protein